MPALQSILCCSSEFYSDSCDEATSTNSAARSIGSPKRRVHPQSEEPNKSEGLTESNVEKWRSMEPSHRLTSAPADVSLLAQQIHFKCGLIAKNRFMKSAMTEKMGEFSVNTKKDRGTPTTRLLRLYEKFGVGDFGIIVTGNIQVSSEFMEAPGNVVFSRDTETEAKRRKVKEWAARAKRYGSLFIAQIAHPGAQASAQVTKEKWDLNALSRTDIQEFIDSFIYSAIFAQKNGFDGIEISGAYFYSLGQFLHGEQNTRTDDYGGSLPNRTRILFDIVNGVRKNIPAGVRFIIGVKLTSLNFEPGYDEKEFLKFVQKLEDSAVDYVTIAGGHFNILKNMSQLERQSSVKRENFYQTAVNAMNKVLKKTPLYMNGGFVTTADMAEAIQGKWTTGIAIGRPVAQEPDLVKKFLTKKASAAAKSLIDVNDFMTSIAAAGTQMWSHGEDEPVLDASNPAHVEAFKKANGEFTKASKENPEKIILGYPKVKLSNQ